ncbi:hypothetical protein F2Q69_00058830 [Brassica cretica]|uniref:Uncharacterized protein n=1 Tax=Brassica cretica TaxID=69181 RepID=A0A8S9RQS0_BRACR|nr:hypothetical protein F2Q69_00058830 [Brassica cretica]
MPVLLKSGQSASREEAIEEMKDCRSMKKHWCYVRKEELLQSPPVHPYEYQKQQRDRDLTSRATGFGTRDP